MVSLFGTSHGLRFPATLPLPHGTSLCIPQRSLSFSHVPYTWHSIRSNTPPLFFNKYTIAGNTASSLQPTEAPAEKHTPTHTVRQTNAAAARQAHQLAMRLGSYITCMGKGSKRCGATVPCHATAQSHQIQHKEHASTGPPPLNRLFTPASPPPQNSPGRPMRVHRGHTPDTMQPAVMHAQRKGAHQAKPTVKRNTHTRSPPRLTHSCRPSDLGDLIG